MAKVSPGIRTLPVFEDDRARLRLTPRHWAYLRIAEGCNQGCSFCTIPGIRGPMRSKPVGQILAEAKELAADGAVELNLIGQDTTSYGDDIGEPGGLSGLLRTLNKQLTDVGWLRLMYAYPSCFTDEMIDTIGSCSRVVKYIDMPLQHVNDRLLNVMKRRVTGHQIRVLLAKLRQIPGMAIRTTLIAGSPGETDAEHAELVEFVKASRFEALGVFPYSPEPGTPMGRMAGQLPDEVKQARVEELMLAQQEIAFARAAETVGRTVAVMIDRPAGRDAEDGYVGRTTAQAPDIDSIVHVDGQRHRPAPGPVRRREGDRLPELRFGGEGAAGARAEADGRDCLTTRSAGELARLGRGEQARRLNREVPCLPSSSLPPVGRPGWGRRSSCFPWTAGRCSDGRPRPPSPRAAAGPWSCSAATPPTRCGQSWPGWT